MFQFFERGANFARGDFVLVRRKTGDLSDEDSRRVSRRHRHRRSQQSHVSANQRAPEAAQHRTWHRNGEFQRREAKGFSRILHTLQRSNYKKFLIIIYMWQITTVESVQEDVSLKGQFCRKSL